MYEEYLRRNTQVARAIGIKGNSEASLKRLADMKNPPKWIVTAFEGIYRRSKTLSPDLADWRDSAEDGPEYAAAPDRWKQPPSRKGTEMEKNEIVQITDETHPWFPTLVVIDEVKSWGIQGFCFIPTNDKEPAGRAYIRLEHGSFENVGSAIIVPE